MKFFTPVDAEALERRISLSDKVMILGSCFADEIGSRMEACGFTVCRNPFGTLYNPASIMNAVSRLDSARPFVGADCVEMGAGASLVCSFEHHTSFARPSSEEFLENANRSLESASEFWRGCNCLIVSLGTARVWRRKDSGFIVSNCLKRPSGEFSNEMLTLREVDSLLESLCSFGKDVIFTVSPIRHLSKGAADNTLSKSLLHLGVRSAAERGMAAYFPAYEILCDELRDYRFYAEDLVHPSRQAADYIWEKFLAAACEPSEYERIAANLKAFKFAAHISHAQYVHQSSSEGFIVV